MNKLFKWLDSETKLWQEEEIITPTQRELILARYTESIRDNRNFGRLQLILYILGTITVALGIILWLAANWPYLSKTVKLALVVSAILASYGGAFYRISKDGESSKAGQALLLLGGLLYGAGIWLVAQIFNLSSDLSPELLMWFAGLLPMVLIIKSVPLITLASIIGFCWSWALVSDKSASPYWYLLPLSFFGLIAHRYRSRLAIIVNLLGLGFWLLSMDYWAGWLIYGAALMGTAYWKENYLKPATFLIGALFAFTQSYIWTLKLIKENPDQAQVPAVIILLALMFLILSAVSWKGDFKTKRTGLILTVMTVGAASLGFLASSGWLIFWSNLVLLVIIYLMIDFGMRHKRVYLINLAILFFFVELITRYFDLAWGMKLRSLFFICGGLLLILVGFLVAKQREKLLKQMREAHEETV